MSNVANLDEAEKCLEIGRAALQTGNISKAARFAEKAMRLHPNDEARKLLRIIKSKQGGTSSASGASQMPNGTASTASSSDMRRRAASSTAGKENQQREDRSTPDQRELVSSILRKKDFYDILGVDKRCTEEDIKRAYKKLALKLHPDKNTAPRADEAFKAVSKSFSCLSDPSKRAAYDRYGEEQPGGGLRGARSPFGGAQGFDDFDPNEIFNMFFGGFPSSRTGPVFRTQFGGPRQQQGEPPTFSMQLLHLLPVIAMLLFTFFAFKPSEPVYSLERMGEYRREVVSQRFSVPYYVKSAIEFEQNYPRGSRDRSRIEQEVESNYKERLDRICYSERLNQQRMYRWGQGAKAKDLPMRACKEIADRFGNQYAYQSSMYGY